MTEKQKKRIAELRAELTKLLNHNEILCKAGYHIIRYHQRPIECDVCNYHV